jgi:hypothetical protein
MRSEPFLPVYSATRIPTEARSKDSFILIRPRAVFLTGVLGFSEPLALRTIVFAARVTAREWDPFEQDLSLCRGALLA